MLKWYTQPEKYFNGEKYRARDIILDEKMIEKILKVPEAIVVSSWRSLEEQKAMVAKGASKTLFSNHRRGMAVDVVNWKEIDKKLEAVGLVNDISWDQNHYTLEGEAKTATKYPMYDSFVKNEKTKYSPKTEPEPVKEEPKEESQLELTEELRASIKELYNVDYKGKLDRREQIELAIMMAKTYNELLVSKVDLEKLQNQVILVNKRNEELSKKVDELSKQLQKPPTTQNMKPGSVLEEILKLFKKS